MDTEAEGHRVAFNEAFARKGLAHEWGLEQYGQLLEARGAGDGGHSAARRPAGLRCACWRRQWLK